MSVDTAKTEFSKKEIEATEDIFKCLEGAYTSRQINGGTYGMHFENAQYFAEQMGWSTKEDDMIEKVREVLGGEKAQELIQLQTRETLDSKF